MTYNRIDHSDYVIHFTKDASPWEYEGSYTLFKKIFQDGYLKESDNLRRGKIPSVCFTEASPMALAAHNKLNVKYFSRYSPFGFMFSKRYIYSLNGLPVIYSPRDHYEPKNEKTNWRTVIYNPSTKREEFQDFTWEREWRIKPKDGKLPITPERTQLFFPSRAWAEKFRSDHKEFSGGNQECVIIGYSQYLLMDIFNLNDIANMYGADSWILLTIDCEDIPLP